MQTFYIQQLLDGGWRRSEMSQQNTSINPAFTVYANNLKLRHTWFLLYFIPWRMPADCVSRRDSSHYDGHYSGADLISLGVTASSSRPISLVCRPDVSLFHQSFHQHSDSIETKLKKITPSVMYVHKPDLFSSFNRKYFSMSSHDQGSCMNRG